ncbi:hypothetical protein ABTH33_20075, partial [Acinetobacter baumannii]
DENKFKQQQQQPGLPPARKPSGIIAKDFEMDMDQQIVSHLPPTAAAPLATNSSDGNQIDRLRSASSAEDEVGSAASAYTLDSNGKKRR